MKKLTEEEIEKEVFLLDKFREELLNDRTRADAFFQIVGIYDSEEKAKTALKRWLDRFNKNGTMQVKILKL